MHLPAKTRWWQGVGRGMFHFLVAGVFGAAAAGAAGPGLAPSEVWTFNARPLARVDVRQPGEARRRWDEMHLLAALQGLVNRDAPRLFLFHTSEFGVETDRFWFDWFRGEDGWLKASTVHALPDLASVLRQFRDRYEGLVVYDERVPATSNLASTAAGVERLLPVRWDPSTNSWFARLTGEAGLPVRLWLVNPDGSAKFTGRGRIPDTDETSTGSAKVDAYEWALHRWLRTGRCGVGLGAYYVDAFWLQRADRASAEMHTLANHDWFIARRAFFFDLSPWADEAPIDEPGQPVGADRRCLLRVLRLLAEGAEKAGGSGGEGGAERIVKIGGFPPWPYKYTTHGGSGRHEPVPTEWEFTRLISQFNAYHEADAAGLGAIANASFSAHYPLAARYRQPNPRPTLADWQARGWVDAQGRVANRLFVGHYVGDYDAPSWLAKAVPAHFRDPALGQVPLGWAFDPNLADRAPQALVYAYRHASTNDWFIAGDSGAGYLNPRGLTVRPDSGLPPALAAWAAYCRPRYERWDMTITGFLLDGAAGASTDVEFAAYREFSPDGLGTHFERGPAVRAGVATCPERDLPDDPAAAAGVILGRARQAADRPGFLWARSILKAPRWYAEVSRRVAEGRRPGERPVEVVDPYSFFGLIRQAEEAAPNP